MVVPQYVLEKHGMLIQWCNKYFLRLWYLLLVVKSDSNLPFLLLGLNKGHSCHLTQMSPVKKSSISVERQILVRNVCISIVFDSPLQDNFKVILAVIHIVELPCECSPMSVYAKGLCGLAGQTFIKGNDICLCIVVGCPVLYFNGEFSLKGKCVE